MQFIKKDGIYIITRISGSQDNILGVSFTNKHSTENNIEVIEWNFPNIDHRKIPTSKEEVLGQVLSGLESMNQSRGTNYQLSKIYFAPSESASNAVYKGLICMLIRHYDDGKEFKEV